MPAAMVAAANAMRDSARRSTHPALRRGLLSQGKGRVDPNCRAIACIRLSPSRAVWKSAALKRHLAQLAGAVKAKQALEIKFRADLARQVYAHCADASTTCWRALFARRLSLAISGRLLWLAELSGGSSLASAHDSGMRLRTMLGRGVSHTRGRTQHQDKIINLDVMRLP